MSTVVMHSVVSVDGFIADANDQVGPLFDWLGNGDVAIIDGGQIKVSQASADYVKTMWAGIGSREQQASYYFISDVARAITKAKELAGERTVAVAAGDVGGQALALGLVDEVGMDVVPVVFGSGKRYFGSVDTQHLLEDPDTVIQGDRVLHLRYRVRR
jgi:hypothetical protein